MTAREIQNALEIQAGIDHRIAIGSVPEPQAILDGPELAAGAAPLRAVHSDG